MPKQNCNSYSGRNKEEGTDGPVRLEICQEFMYIKYYCNYRYILYIVDLHFNKFNTIINIFLIDCTSEKGQMQSPFSLHAVFRALTSSPYIN